MDTLRIAGGDARPGYASLPHWIDLLGLPLVATSALRKLVRMCHGPYRVDCPTKQTDRQ